MNTIKLMHFENTLININEVNYTTISTFIENVKEKFYTYYFKNNKRLDLISYTEPTTHTIDNCICPIGAEIIETNHNTLLSIHKKIHFNTQDFYLPLNNIVYIKTTKRNDLEVTNNILLTNRRMVKIRTTNEFQYLDTFNLIQNIKEQIRNSQIHKAR